MKVSIIIPVYNAEQFLSRCLDSILRQTIDEKEIICVDDGSTDCSMDILRKYERENDNFYVLTQERQYAGVARNYGLSVAKGEYIHFMDADDYIPNDIYSSVYDLAVKMDADYIKTRSTAFDIDSGAQIIKSNYSLDKLDISCFNRRISLEECPEVLLNVSVTPWSGWVRRQYLLDRRILFNGLKCVNDRSFYAEVISNTNKIIVGDFYMVAHQVNNHGSLFGMRGEHFGCVLQSFRTVEEKICDCPSDIRKKIMASELSDVIASYSMQSIKQKEKNKGLFVDFFGSLDWGGIDMDIFLGADMKKWQMLKRPPDCLQLYSIQEVIDAKELAERLSLFDTVIIYGAGAVGMRVLNFLIEDKKLMNVLCLAVTDRSDNVESLFGKPIREINSLTEYREKAAIIIGTTEVYQKEIVEKLKYLGFQNIFQPYIMPVQPADNLKMVELIDS